MIQNHLYRHPSINRMVQCIKWRTYMIIIELYTTQDQIDQNHSSLLGKMMVSLPNLSSPTHSSSLYILPQVPNQNQETGQWPSDSPPEFEWQKRQQLLRHEETGKQDRDSFSFFIICFGLVTTSMSKKILHSSCVNALTQSGAAGTSWTQCPAPKRKKNMRTTHCCH
jgi:hypothetical protein